MSRGFDRIDHICVLCGRTREQLKKQILGVHGGICLDCIELCNEVIHTGETDNLCKKMGWTRDAQFDGSFCILCGKKQNQVKMLLLGMRGGVCTDCIELCNDIIRTEAQEAEPKRKAEQRQESQPTRRPERTMGKPLEGKVAIVTGASRGIGAAIAKRLAADGAKVVVNYSRSAESATQVVAEIEAAGGEASAFPADVSDLTLVKQLFARTMEQYGRLDILVNNAGVAGMKPLDEIDEEHYARLFDINVRGALFATQEAARCFGDAGGRIINITSGAARACPPGMSVYSATKAALEAMTRSHAYELGARNILVNAVAPGFTETDMLQDALPPERRKAIIAATPLRRIGDPAEVADVVAFLASDDARWITAQVIDANGGLR